MVLGIVAVGVFVVGDRLRPKTWREPEGEPGTVVELINTLFIAVAAFVVVIGWQNYDNAHNHTVAEAKGLVEVYRGAGDLPDSARVQNLVRQYTGQVVTEEWSVMDEQRKLADSAQATLDELRSVIEGADTGVAKLAGTATDPDSDPREAVLASLDAVEQSRVDRALDAGLAMPGFLYFALWLTAFLLLFSAVLSGVVVNRRSLVMTALLGVVVGGTITVIYGLDRPFSGSNVVSKAAFELALSRFDQISG
ncbi:DUF4239 domain-containing protein [Nocardia sp. NPDC127579]|uniref:bestrophin-like domain n=1 Tax=Nocardia sp. NPDC127579 TaxID=3345402 RepID=UPI00362807DA